MNSGTVAISADGVVGSSGKPTVVYGFQYVGGASPRALFYNGTGVTGGQQKLDLSFANSTQDFIDLGSKGVFFPDGCYVDITGISSLIVSYEHQRSIASTGRFAADGAVGTSGDPIRVYSVNPHPAIVTSGDLVLRNGTADTDTVYIDFRSGALGAFQNFGKYGILFPDGCFYDHDSNIASYVTYEEVR